MKWLFLGATLFILCVVITQKLCDTNHLSWEHARSVLYAPWREAYVSDHKKTGDCPFCTQLAEQLDAKNLVLARYKNFAIMLNLYPLSKGHLLIIPYHHVARIADLSVEQRAELMELINMSIETLQDTLHPDAMNVGINLGKSAGASIPDHLHVHVLPRWIHVDSFISLIGNTQVIDWDMHKLYEQLWLVFQIFGA